MKRIQRLLSMLLVCCIVVGMLPTTVMAAHSDTDIAYAVEGGNIYFNAAMGTITDCDESVTSAIIPSEIDGISITSIGNSSFKACRNLASIDIPSSVTSIGIEAFIGCENLSGIAIPFGVTSISDYTFKQCSGLTEISIPSTLTDIGNEAFKDCSSLASIVIPASVTKIGHYAFDGCTNFKSAGPIGGEYDYQFGWTESIPVDAFYGCSGLESITIPSSVISIGDGAFSGCSNLASVNIPKGVTNIGPWTFKDCSNLTNIIIPSGVTNIGDGAFSGCSGLSRVAIPSGVTNIGSEAFKDCSGLVNFAIPSGITNIGMATFYRCHGLESIIIPSSVIEIGREAFWACGNLSNVYYSGSSADWGNITIDQYINSSTSGGNNSLINATIHYNSTGPDNVGSDNMNSVYFLSGWDESTRQVKFGDSEFVSPDTYTVADDVDVSSIDQLLNKYVLVAMEQGDSVLEHTITDIQPVESKIGTVSASGEHSLTIDGITYPVREDYVLASYDGKKVLYHICNGTIMDFTILEEKHGVLGSWNDATKRLTIGETEYPTNDLSDLSFMDNIRDYFQKDVRFLVADSSNYCPFLGITGLYSSGGEVNTFNADVYHANWLSQDTTSAAMLNQRTPCDILSSELTSRGMETATVMWKSLQVIFDSLDDPVSTIKKFGFEKKDMYSAIILDTLEASVSYDVIDSFFEDYYEQLGKMFKEVSQAIQRQHNIDITKPGEFAKMTAQQRKDLQKETKKWFDETLPELTVANSIFDGISMGFDSIESLEDYGERIASTLLLANVNESMKDVIRRAYQNSQATNNLDLRLALNECVKIMDASTEELCQRLVVGEITVLGGKALKYLVKELLWSEVTKTLNEVAPEVAVLKAVYKAGSFLCDKLTNASSAIEQYLKMLAILDVENLMNGVYNDLGQAFVNEKDTKKALAYLEAMRFIFNLRSIDCESAIEYVDVIAKEDVSIFDDSLLLTLKRLFGAKDTDDIQALKKSIQNIQSDYQVGHVGAETNWIYQLDDDYPGEGLTAKHESLVDKARRTILKKEFTVACPVNVYVYNQSGNVVASVVDGRVSCSVDGVMIALLGEQKVVRLYDDANYRIEYIGYGTGNMDITITEFDARENAIRTVNYYDVALANEKAYSMDVAKETLKPYSLEDKTNNITVKHDYDSMDSNIKHTVKVISGTLQQNGELFVETLASKGETLQLDAYVPEGYEFVRWETSNVAALVDDPSSVNTTMIMVDEDIIATAIMKTSNSSFTISVQPSSAASTTGIKVNGQTTTTANESDTVVVTPAAAEAGKRLNVTAAAGSNAVTVTDNGDGTYSFTMPAANVTVTVETVTVYALTLTQPAALAGSAALDKTTAAVGDTVTVTVTAATGFECIGIAVLNDGKQNVSVFENKDPAGKVISYYFEMPANPKNVEVIPIMQASTTANCVYSNSGNFGGQLNFSNLTAGSKYVVQVAKTKDAAHAIMFFTAKADGTAVVDVLRNPGGYVVDLFVYDKEITGTPTYSQLTAVPVTVTTTK